MYKYEQIGIDYDNGFSRKEIAKRRGLSISYVDDAVTRYKKNKAARKQEFINANYIRGAWEMANNIELMKKKIEEGKYYGVELRPDDLRENQEAQYLFLLCKHVYPNLVAFQKPDGTLMTMTWFEMVKAGMM